jgi:hypothetical protein
MNGKQWRISYAIVLAFVLQEKGFSSSDTIGPNGISSANLRGMDGEVFTGSGIAIGQVEPGRPVKSGVDNSSSVNSHVTPAAVFLLDGNPTPNSDNIMLDSGHATRVAGVMISTDTTDPPPDADGDAPVGVAIEALLYASATNEPTAPAQPEAALAAQHVALQHSGEVHAINFSFLESRVDGHIPDGNSLLTLFVDWSAAQHEVLYVIANRGITESCVL